MIRFNTFARYNPLPKVVLLNVDFMSTLHSSSDSQYEREQYFPYIKDDSLINAIKEQKRITMAERYLPFWRYYGYREEIGNGLSAFWGNDSFFDGGMYKGYRGNNYAWSQGLLAADTIVDVVAEASNSVEKLLDAYLDSMTQKDVKVLLVKSPIYDPLFAKLVNVEYSDSVFMSLSQKYDIPLLDYYHSDISADSTFFYNPSHLNQKGAEAFTRQLCDDIISMGLLANTVSSK